MKINEQWKEQKGDSHANIQSKKGGLKRQSRSIQTKEHFREIKEIEYVRHFNYLSSEKVYKGFMLYAIDRNMNIVGSFRVRSKNSKEKATRKKLRQRKVLIYGNEGILRSKISSKRKSKKLL